MFDAVHADGAAMQANELLDEIESETRTRYAQAARIRCPREAIEDARELVVRNADPAIAYGDRYGLLLAADHDLHRRIVRRVLHGIFDEIGKDLAQALLVADDPRVALDRNGDEPAVRERRRDLLQERAQIHRAALQDDIVAFQSRERERIARQRRQLLRGSLQVV